MEEYGIPPTEESTQEASLPTLAVDILREEYEAFALLQGKVTGPMRRRVFSLLLSLILCLMLVGMIFLDWRETGRIDPVTVVAIPLMLLPTLFSYCLMPALLRRRARKGYDRRQQHYGDRFYGTVTVYPDRIEKTAVITNTTVKIPLNAHTLFVEREDMMLVINRFYPSLVLPARCMTGGMAAAVRQAADRLPMGRRVFLSRLNPQNQPAVLPIDVSQPEETLWEQVVIYTPQESYQAARPLVFKQFWMRSPLFAILSLMMAYLLGWDGSGNLFTPMLWFLLCLGTLTLLNVVMPLSRMRRTARSQESRERTIRFRITQKAVYYSGLDVSEIGLLWAEIAHVYDKDTMVEIEILHGGSLFIPKRCIEDLDRFDEIVRNCRKLEYKK